MCLSATVSYSTAAILLATGLYTLRLSWHRKYPVLLLALVPIFFSLQQGLEGRVWQELHAGRVDQAIPYALAFHFFSHFLWLWWLPLCSYLMEPTGIRKQVFAGHAIIGALLGGTGYAILLFHPEWMKVGVEHHSITYDITLPRSDYVDIPIPAAIPYALIILVPLVFSSLRPLRIFGIMVTLSMVLASLAYGYALVSVWCFFAAMLSIYLAYTIQIHGRKGLAV